MQTEHINKNPTLSDLNERLKNERKMIEEYLLKYKIPPNVAKELAKGHRLGGSLTHLILIG